MYEDFYGFHEPPFNITPDPRFLFYSERHREAFDHLLFGIAERKGFIQLTGEVGAGKTTLCRALFEHLGETYETALVLNPRMTSLELLRSILTEFGLDSSGEDRLTGLETLNRFLLDQVEHGKDVVVVIDEAQTMGVDLLEEVRLLSNLETDQRKLLQIVLIGQPELRVLLNDKRLRQLRQRITVRYHLKPLTVHETGHYIGHRMRLAGANGRPVFGHWALRWVYHYSKGVPRLINAVCDKTLLCGFVDQVDQLRARHVRRAIRELEGKIA